jgi:hypothetical protein
MCANLYSAGTATSPYYAYNHAAAVVGADGCPTGHSSISGLAFASGYRAPYAGALFFSDYSRGCIWAILPDSNGLPDSANIVPIITGAAGPVTLQLGPGGDLYYVAIQDGTIHRIGQS